MKVILEVLEPAEVQYEFQHGDGEFFYEFGGLMQRVKPEHRTEVVSTVFKRARSFSLVTTNSSKSGVCLRLFGRVGQNKFLTFDISESGLVLPSSPRWQTFLSALVLARYDTTLEIGKHAIEVLSAEGLLPERDHQMHEMVIEAGYFAREFRTIFTRYVRQIKVCRDEEPEFRLEELEVIRNTASKLWPHTPLGGLLRRLNLE